MVEENKNNSWLKECRKAINDAKWSAGDIRIEALSLSDVGMKEVAKSILTSGSEIIENLNKILDAIEKKACSDDNAGVA